MKIILPQETTGKEIADAVERTAKAFGLRSNIGEKRSGSDIEYGPMFREKTWQGEETIGFWFTTQQKRGFFLSQRRYRVVTLRISLCVWGIDPVPWTIWVESEEDPLFDRLSFTIEKITQTFLSAIDTVKKTNDPA